MAPLAGACGTIHKFHRATIDTEVLFEQFLICTAVYILDTLFSDDY